MLLKKRFFFFFSFFFFFFFPKLIHLIMGNKDEDGWVRF